MGGFVAIDFETANAKPESAISLGLVRVEEFDIVEEKYWLIKPPTKDFHKYSMKLHGIHPEDVAMKETFKELWSEIQTYLDEKVIVAHNTSFDIRVLRSLLKKYSLPVSFFTYYCSVKISQKVWPDLRVIN
jgi:DNA polymerase-3 subunit epsilon